MESGARIEELIAPSLERAGFRVVRVKLTGGGRRTLQVMATPCDGRAMTVDHCAELSRTISAILDVEDPIPGPYVLEVSSPGLDRPLTRREDFERFRGLDVRLETRRADAGRRRYRGRLLGLVEDRVRISSPDGAGEKVFEIPFGDVASARLVPADGLGEAGSTRGMDDDGNSEQAA